MEIAVLLKAVADAETIRFDPERRAVVRHGTELRANPFDQRALRVALELARGDESVRVVSMGPEEAGPVLEEALALGAREAWHLCDPAFAGSDVLATSRALAAQLRALRVDVVLAGDRTTDSDTGLVGPEVATLLGVPVVGGARAIVRDAGAEVLTATVDLGERTRVVRVEPPVVVTVGEKIAKPLKLDPARLAAVDPRQRFRVKAASLPLGPESLGAVGSPTSVASIEWAARTRVPRTFSGPSTVRAVEEAVEALGPLLARGSPQPGALPPWKGEPGAPWFALLASDEDGRLNEGVLGWCSQVRRALPGFAPLAVWFGDRPTAVESASLAAAGALKGLHLVAETAAFDPEGAALEIASVLDRPPAPAAWGFVSEPFGRELAGRLAASRGLGAVGDATDLRPAPEGGIRFVKPSFGGNTWATIDSRTRPLISTLRGGVHPPTPSGGARLAWTKVPTNPRPRRVRLVDAPSGPLSRALATPAEVVVAVGMGVGGPEGVEQAGSAAQAWGARLTGTRRVVDAGWLPTRAQVGLTGTSLAPRLAVLLGVRGSSHHMIGWRRAETVLAVNADPAAPVFAEADVGIVGRVEEVLPLLLAPVRALLDDLRAATARASLPPP